jgi:hypothetical protein
MQQSEQLFDKELNDQLNDVGEESKPKTRLGTAYS